MYQQDLIEELFHLTDLYSNNGVKPLWYRQPVIHKRFYTCSLLQLKYILFYLPLLNCRKIPISLVNDSAKVQF